MLKKLFILFIVFASFQSNAQRWGDFEIGPMLNYEYTSLIIPTGEIVIRTDGASREWKNTGYESNFSAGIYTMFYFDPRVGVGGELYYDRISSTEFGDENYYTSITFLPFANFNFFERLENLYFGAGGGVSFIQNSPEYGPEVEDKDIREITIPLKLSASYRFRNMVTIETGVHGEVLVVVKDLVKRNSFFIGVKIPVNRIVGNYRY